MKLVIFGSRGITDIAEVERAVAASGVLPQVTEIISGGAKGVDTLAQQYAEQCGIPFRLFPPDWEKHGNSAGARRNEEMAAHADFGVAVWDGKSRGTEHMIGLMQGRVFVWKTEAQAVSPIASTAENSVNLKPVWDAELDAAAARHPKLRLTLPWENIEDSAREQLGRTLLNPALETLVALPDVHWGKDVCIGSVVLMNGVIVPSFVGVDIGCGMAHVNTRRSVADLGLVSPEDRKLLFRRIQKIIPHGKGIGNRILEPYPDVFTSASLSRKEQKRINHRAAHDWGTLGHGNHFIEVGLNERGEVGITLHSGSRSPGYNIAEHYILEAGRLHRGQGVAPFFEMRSELGQAYYHDMHWAASFAAANRLRMLERLLGLFAVNAQDLLRIEKTHNHALWDQEKNQVLHRKGAIPAGAGEYGIIPGSQLDGVYVTRGLGNEHFLCSASHGAGRAMSRQSAFRHESNEKFKELMAGIVCRTDTKVQDEAPWAYKDIHAVVRNQVENKQVEVVDYFKPIVVVKG
jgi:tRNA-splicing ligase RtcB